VFEKYRGFIWGPALERVDTFNVEPAINGDPNPYKTTAYVPMGPTLHFRGDPNRKTLFVKAEGFEFPYTTPAVPTGSMGCNVACPFALGSAFIEDAGIEVHVLSLDADPTAGAQKEQNIDVITITNDRTNPFPFTDGNINKRGVRDWSWDTKGSSGIGTATVYGANTTHYQVSLEGYVGNRTYIDGKLNGKLDALPPSPSADVEDADDNGELKTTGSPSSREDCCPTQNAFDGDVWEPGNYAVPGGMTTMDNDNDGRVELPIQNTPGNPGVHDSFEATVEQVVKHTITHELGHAVGMVHDANAGCLMYEYSTDWDRDACFSGSGNSPSFVGSKADMRIHND
jgi:hypothetical protein